MGKKIAYTVSLWDNAAIYTDVRAGDRLRLNDVKISRRDNQPNITIRYSDQIEVIYYIYPVQLEKLWRFTYDYYYFLEK